MRIGKRGSFPLRKYVTSFACIGQLGHSQRERGAPSVAAHHMHDGAWSPQSGLPLAPVGLAREKRDNIGSVKSDLPPVEHWIAGGQEPKRDCWQYRETHRPIIGLHRECCP